MQSGIAYVDLTALLVLPLDERRIANQNSLDIQTTSPRRYHDLFVLLGVTSLNANFDYTSPFYLSLPLT